MKTTADLEWGGTIVHLLQRGREAHPRAGMVGSGETLELLGYQTRFWMQFPVVLRKLRKLSYRFMCAEAYWILSGDDRVGTIAPFAPSIAKFSDDGKRFYGAYGPRVSDQLESVVNQLANDGQSRQAVLTIWRPNPTPSKDIPCTVAVQWLIRDGLLHCVDTMRSSDVWLGWPYDAFNFTMLSAKIALMLRDEGVEVSLGELFLNAGSQHLYLRNKERAEECVLSRLGNGSMPAFDPLSWFDSPHALMEYLRACSRRSSSSQVFGWVDSLCHGI